MKVINKSGKRKTAIARATMKPGKGIVKINRLYLENYSPELARLKIKEPIVLAGDFANKFDFYVRVIGGGWQSQAEAARLAIARCLVEANKALKPIYVAYDRRLLVADTRRKEERKPNDSSGARAKRQKSYR